MTTTADAPGTSFGSVGPPQRRRRRLPSEGVRAAPSADELDASVATATAAPGGRRCTHQHLLLPRSPRVAARRDVAEEHLRMLPRESDRRGRRRRRVRARRRRRRLGVAVAVGHLPPRRRLPCGRFWHNSVVGIAAAVRRGADTRRGAARPPERCAARPPDRCEVRLQPVVPRRRLLADGLERHGAQVLAGRHGARQLRAGAQPHRACRRRRRHHLGVLWRRAVDEPLRRGPHDDLGRATGRTDVRRREDHGGAVLVHHAGISVASRAGQAVAKPL